MTPYKIYCEYLSIKSHFNNVTYNHFKYGKTRGVSLSKFEERRDKYFFDRLAKHPDPINVMVANFAKNQSVWIGDIISEEGLRVYKDWNKRIQSLSYTFKQEINQLKPSFDENIQIGEGEHPHLIQLFLSSKISLETLVIVVDIARCYSYWSKTLGADDIVWKEVSTKIIKYRPFFQYERAKYKSIILEKFSE